MNPALTIAAAGISTGLMGFAIWHHFRAADALAKQLAAAPSERLIHKGSGAGVGPVA